MNEKILKFNFYFLINLLLLGLVSCGGINNIQDDHPSTQTVIRSTPGLSTAVQEPTSTAVTRIEIPTEAPLSVDTPTPRHPTPTLIPTRLPTLSATEAFETVAQLELDNGGCQFPCWWGIEPGKSTWSDTAPFIQTLAYSFFAAGEDDSLKIYEAVFPIDPFTPSLDFNKHVTFYVNQEDTIEVIVAGRELNVKQLLELYGTPAQIWIHPDGLSKTDVQVFYVKLFYPDQGMIAWEIAKGVPTSSQNMQVCLDYYQDSIMGFYFFRPDAKKEFEAVPDVNSHYPTEKRKLEEVSELNPDTFYKTFILPDANPCFDILKDAWPPDS